MNVIFITISNILDIKHKDIYSDLMRRFSQEGHHVYILSPTERRYKKSTRLIVSEGVTIVKVKIPNYEKTNKLEKGVSMLLIEYLFKKAIEHFLSDVTFDLILYSTPPITFNQLVLFLKKRNPKAISYLLLKDIFPQNAVDLGMISKQGIIYQYLRRKEIQLYKVSDYIGCMSPANVEYVKANNSFINPTTIEVAPNSIQISDLQPFDRVEARRQYNISQDDIVFVYGGNLGMPQGIDHMINCLEECIHLPGCHFIIVGSGTEYSKISKWYLRIGAKNITFLSRLTKEKYDKLVRASDVGLIFLDHRFTIPNYPSRLLSYLEFSLPILACTDISTDIGRIAESNGYGLWCESNSVEVFVACVKKFMSMGTNLKKMGEKGRLFLENNYNIDVTYHAIMKHFQSENQRIPMN